ncbi:hypothetical protein Sked_10360 [Sanguibacter keddieii DSM 10542]|uniref:Uncharacterized protein n=1 Tax=Sanguibacter keddieii (strain ATCC 51767 / DSM 10542 / NCFB 3025 / ST-74) TaxID=446469 RepID=D1BCY7_SANKS|nr:hypothetical protein Sked_10360 [Sanguibacter keddieii DSM 10542]
MRTGTEALVGGLGTCLRGVDGMLHAEFTCALVTERASGG